MRHVLACLALAASISPALAQPDAAYCANFRQFREAPFAKGADGKPLRRAIEVHWIGNWLDLDKGWRIECRGGDTDAGKALCAALKGNINSEFSNHLPLDILTCYGWGIPTPWNGLDLRQVRMQIGTDEKGKVLDETDRYLLLETDMRPRDQRHDAIRLSVVPWDENHSMPEPVLEIDDPADPVLEATRAAPKR